MFHFSEKRLTLDNFDGFLKGMSSESGAFFPNTKKRLTSERLPKIAVNFGDHMPHRSKIEVVWSSEKYEL